MGELKQHNMKTLLLLSILGLALVSADLKTEDQHTEDANVVAVDDSAEAMDDLDGEDSRRSRGGTSCTTYRAVLGPDEPLANDFTGSFTMKLCDGRPAKYKTNIKGDFDGETGLKYHLHSDYSTEAVKGVIGGPGTGGHYDPTFKCGKFSSNQGIGSTKDLELCPASSGDDYPCAQDIAECELGDLGGKNGNIEIKRGKTSKRTVKDKGASPRRGDYSGTGSQSGSTFSSIIFHKASDGSRFFGGRLVPVCEGMTYKATLDGTGINSGVEGSFRMRICEDGSIGNYKGSLTNVDSLTNGDLKYHLHSAFGFDNGALGGTGTGGHYDPFFKCGGASSFKGAAGCEANYPDNGYELGDLSGRNGLIPCTTGTCTIRVIDSDPPRNVDYSQTGSTGRGDTFASVVFHDASTGARLFGAQLHMH